MKRIVGTLGGLLTIVTSAQAQQERAFELEVRAPEVAACTSADALAARVAERAGSSAHGVEPSARARVLVVIAAHSGGHRAVVTMRDGDGEVLGQREVHEPGACTALDEPLTLVIASGVGMLTAPLPQTPPAAADAPSPEVPAPDEVIEATPAAEPTPLRFVSTPPASGPDEPAAWTFDLELAARGLTGVLPRPSGTARLGVYAGAGGLVLGASAIWLVPATFRQGSEHELQATGIGGELSACGRLAEASITTLWLCAGVQAGALRADAPRLWRAAPRWDALVQLAPSMRARLALARGFGLALGCGAGVPLVFPRYAHRDEAGALMTDHEVELGVWAELGLWARLN